MVIYMSEKYKEIQHLISSVEGCGGVLDSAAKDLVLRLFRGEITHECFEKLIFERYREDK